MPPVEDHAQLASDAELITRVRAGDRSAFGDLYSRHSGAALALARQFSRSAAEADDLVAEAFARVLDAMLESRGPDTAFRAYLFTTLRNTAYDRTRKDKRLQFSDDMESHDVAVDGGDPIIAELEKGLIGKAFAGLPERWQTVLWHVQVEGQSVAEVGVLLGMAPNAVSSLAFRAREGLREAYLQDHLAETAAERCRTTVDRLGGWTRGGLSKREKAQVDAHLEECDRCPALAAELSEINTGLRGLLAPLLLGGAAVGYLATLGPVVPLAQLGVLTGGKVAATAGGKGIVGHAAAGLAKIGSFGPAAVAAGVAAVAAVVVAGIAIALSSGHPAPTTAGAAPSAAAAVTSSPVAGSGAEANNGGGNGRNTGPAAPDGTVRALSSAKTSTTRPVDAPATRIAPGIPIRPTAPTPTGSAGTSPTTPLSPRSNDPGSSAPGLTAPATSGSIAPQSTRQGTRESTTTRLTTTRPSTTPPLSVAVMGVSADTTVSADLSVGGTGQFSLKIANNGNAASEPGQRMKITLPTGVRIDRPALTLALRGGSSAFAATAPLDLCAQAVGSTITCALPALAADKTLTVNFRITAEPQAAASSAIEVTFAGGTTNSIPVSVGTGYGDVSITSPNDFGRASTGIATLAAAPKVTGTDAGALSFPLTIAPGMTITGLAPGGTSASAGIGCAIGTDAIVCPSGAAAAGIAVTVTVDKGATTGANNTASAIDQGGRQLATGSLIVSNSVNGGYTAVNPIELDPVGSLAQGTTSNVTLVGHPLPGVISPGPIVIPINLTNPIGLTIDVTDLPTGCILNPDASPVGATVTCSPADNHGSATFSLQVIVAPRATGGALAAVTLPVGSTPSLQIAGSSFVEIDPTRTGYQGIAARIDGLNAGTSGSLTLVGTVNAGITDPGKITIPVALGSGVSITGSANDHCVLDAISAICTPSTSGTTTWKLFVRTASDAEQGTLTFPSFGLVGLAQLTPSAAGSDLTVRGAATSCNPAADLANGDFEFPQVPNGAGLDEITGTNQLIWKTTALDQLVEFWRTDGTPAANAVVQAANNGVSIGADSGNQWLELNANFFGALYEDVPSVPGQIMHWAISHRGRAVLGHDGVDTMQVLIGSGADVTAQIPDDAENELDPTLISDGPAEWGTYNGSYIVPAGQTTTRFELSAVSTSSGNQAIGNFVDHASVSTQPCLITTTTVTNSAPDHPSPQPGDVLTYLTTAKNIGGDTAGNVVVSDPAPANTTEIPGSRSPIVTSIDPGQSVTASFRVTVDADVPDMTVISNNVVLSFTWSPSTDSLESISNTVTSTVFGSPTAAEHHSTIGRSVSFR